ncbi:MAG: FadR family transcriptional regulator [Deltaproteobacteria bacterium]|nr:FadR family transcriptional regulator [Deltaproteobacteria bacterium]
MSQIPRYETVVNTLARLIFTGHIAPGTKLPTERALASEMDIDRTSLRLALKQLENLGALDIRPGDGIYARDFMEGAGLDFLKLVFSLEEGEGGGPFEVDAYTIDEVWEFWCGFFPMMLKNVIGKFSPRDVKRLLDLVDEEMKCVNCPERIIELNLAQEDLVAAATKNIVFILFSNVSRPIRKRMLKLFADQSDPEVLSRHIELKRVFLEEFLNSPEKMIPLAAAYEDVLMSHLAMMRKRRMNGTGSEKLAESFSHDIRETIP